VNERRQILGALLVERGLLSPEALERGLDLQARTGERLGTALLHLGEVSEEELYRALAFQLDLGWEESPLEPEPGALRRVQPAFARRRRLLPLRQEGRELVVAMADPLDLRALDDLQFQCGGRVRAVVTPPSALLAALESAFPDPAASSPEAPGPPARPARASEVRAIENAEGGAAPRLVDTLLRTAVSAGTSDLHIEPAGHGVAVRMRIDGILRRIPELESAQGSAVLSRIKVLAGMDIAVRMRPQDGGFTIREAGANWSIRVSSLPVEEGEKAVLRLLRSDTAPTGLAELGLAGEDLARVRRTLRAGSGVLLTAGPTGSGKSSTLSAAVAELDRERLNVVTLEDPVEYRIPGVSQVQVRPRAGLTFPSALRAVLRQDPDVVMVGEIRDRETAEIAMAAAVTGHLVLSTIHTIDAPSGIARLLHMGVPPYLVAGGLSAIVAQRLVRRTCPRCGGRPEGCDECPDGYRGRTGIFQVLVMNEGLRDDLVRGADTSLIRRRARAGGMGSMADDARRKVAEGVTSPHEVARVLREDPGEAFPCRRCEGAVPPEASGCPHCGHPLASHCRCGTRLREGWRFCPDCLRRAPALA
jgi:type IV pilus assembly protein PilB